MVIERAVDTEILKRVQSILSRKLDICPSLAHRDARLREDLGADLIDMVELVMAIGCEFGSEVLDEDFRGINTVGQLATYIEQKCTGVTEYFNA